jgi:hypothetical protein
MRIQVGRQRKEILQLQRAGISTASAEALLEKMHTKIDGLCEQRERLKRLDPAKRVAAYQRAKANILPVPDIAKYVDVSVTKKQLKASWKKSGQIAKFIASIAWLIEHFRSSIDC